MKELKLQYESLEANGVSQIQNIYLKLANLQGNLRLINNSIKNSELEILDINSTLSYEAVQLDRFMVELRDYMAKQKIEIPANTKFELNS